MTTVDGLLGNISIITASTLGNTDIHNPCLKNFTSRPDLNRTCGTRIIECIYGLCIIVSTNPNRWKCECDNEAQGDLCETKCCRKCGEHGWCVVDNEVEKCSCHENYEGPWCEKHIPPSVAPRAIAGNWLYSVIWYLSYSIHKQHLESSCTFFRNLHLKYH